MSTMHAVQTVFEFLMLGAIIVGFKYETAIAKWERKQAKKILSVCKRVCHK